MADVRRIVAEFAAQDKSAAAVASFERRFTNLSRTLLRIAGIGGGIYALKRGFDAVTQAAMEQEKAEKALEAALGHGIDTHKEYAKQMQRQTIYGDELILSQMAYGKNLGIVEDKLKDATTAAIGLAAKYKLDLQSSMMLVGRASQNQTQMLTRYGIVLDETLSAEEKFNELLKIGADAFHLARAEAETAAGVFEQWKNASGDLKEALGEKLLPVLTDITKEMTKIVQTDWGDIFHTLEVGPDIVFEPDMSKISEGMKKAAQQAYREMTGEIDAFTRSASKGWGLAWQPGEDIKPKNLELYNKLLQEQLRLQKQANEFVGPLLPEVMSTDGGTEAKAWTDRMTNLRKQVNEEIAMLGRLNEPRQHAKMLIQFEAEAMEQFGKGTIEAKTAVNEFREDLDRLAEAQKWDEMAKTMEGSYTNAIEGMLFENMKFRDAAVQVAREIAMEYIRLQFIRPIASGLAGFTSGFFGGGAAAGTNTPVAYGGGTGGVGENLSVPVGHDGGTIGVTNFPRRNVPASLFNDAPRLHSGLRSDEFPAILQRGETVTPKGQSGGGATHITNNYITIKALDSQDVQKALSKEKNFLSDLSLMSKKGNHPSRRYEK